MLLNINFFVFKMLVQLKCFTNVYFFFYFDLWKVKGEINIDKKFYKIEEKNDTNAESIDTMFLLDFRFFLVVNENSYDIFIQGTKLWLTPV